MRGLLWCGGLFCFLFAAGCAAEPKDWTRPDGKAVAPAQLEIDRTDAFVVYNGVRIAKRGQPNSPQAGTWVSLEPGFRVFDEGYPLKLVIERDGKIIKTVW